MSNTERPAVGTIVWQDLTVANADVLQDFYAHVLGWEPSPVEMAGYDDYTMVPPASSAPVAGICHAKGPNADLPPQWLLYVVVADLDLSIETCKELGGSVVAAARPLSGGRYCVIRDPAGAVCGLYQAPLA